MEAFLKTRRNILLRLVFTFQRSISFGLLLALIILVLLQVYTRYVLNNPLTWTEEVARFANVLLTFFAASYVSAEREHLRIAFKVKGMGRLGESIVDWFALVAVIAVGSIMVWGSYLSASGSQISAPASGIPMSFLYLGVMLGYTLMVVHALIEAWEKARGTVDSATEAVPGGVLP